MGYKWIGAVFILTACTGCGVSIAVRKRMEERMLLQLQHVLQFMESELQYRLTPLPELCHMAATQVSGQLQTIFRNLNRELTWQKLPDASSCMAAAIRNSEELPATIRRLLVQLGQTLGRFDLQGQIRGIQAVQSRCEDSLKRIQDHRDERMRSYVTLFACAGASLAIILA